MEGKPEGRDLSVTCKHKVCASGGKRRRRSLATAEIASPSLDRQSEKMHATDQEVEQKTQPERGEIIG